MRLLPAAGILLFASACLAQQPPDFEAASIKLNTTGLATAGLGLPPGRLIATNVPIGVLVTFAYRLQDSQMTGAPDWVNTIRYNVEAKAEGTPTPDQIRLMVRSMLADRLKMAVHRETREAQVYDLVPAKGGLKLKPTAAGSCQIVDRDHPPVPPTPGTPPPCGRMGLGPGQINGWGMPMASFAQPLSNFLGRPVTDKTGAPGNYDIALRFAMDQSISPNMAGPPGAVDALPPPDPAAPNIFIAVEEQLGLKLESARGQTEVLVIDHIERPTEN